MIKRAVHTSLFKIFSLNSQGLQNVMAFSVMARAESGSQHKILFLIWIQIHSPCLFLEDALELSVTPVPLCPSQGWASGPGEQSQVPPVPPAPAQSPQAQIMQHSWASSFTAHGQRVAHILTSPRWELLPRRSRRQGWGSAQLSSGSGHALGEGFTGWAESQVAFALLFPVSLLWMLPWTLNSSAENWRWS